MNDISAFGETLDRILYLLKDSQWHLTDELKAKLLFPSDEKLNEIIRFFDEYEFINFNEEEKKAKIEPLGLSFLELPSEEEM
ncbi:MAG: hypothetical protein WBD09_08365 [Halobacteriota archaeon]